jgi:hypothetical protein
VHSPIGKEPEKFGLTLRPPRFEGFASNDVPFDDPTPCPHERLSEGLRKAVYNYMHGAGLDEPVEKWFI